MDRVHAPSGQVVAAGAPRPVVQAITKEHMSLIDSVQDKLDAAYYVERENETLRAELVRVKQAARDAAMAQEQAQSPRRQPHIDDSLRRLQRNLADDVAVGRKRTEADIWAGNFRLGAPDC